MAKGPFVMPTQEKTCSGKWRTHGLLQVNFSFLGDLMTKYISNDEASKLISKPKPTVTPIEISDDKLEFLNKKL
jgi:hypothetical protein